MGGRTVLLVDDDADIRFIAEIALARVGGFAVRLAGSAMEARQELEVVRPDALLLDVTMPEVDGPTFFSQLRAEPRWDTMPVVFLTARTSIEEVHHYLSLGAVGVLAKPFDPMTLAHRLREILDW